MAGLGMLDWILLAVLVMSVLIGVWRGLVFEVLSLLGWIVAYVVAQWFAPAVGPYLPVGRPFSAINHAVAFAVVFILVIIVWGLASRLVRLLVSASPLSVPDRMLGAIFGLLRGLVFLVAVATVVSMTPAARSQAWRESLAVAWLNKALFQLKPLLPAELARYLPSPARSKR
jgi:membrane protein required for colicin V production